MNWICLPFEQLSNHQLYDLLKLRVDVFVVEQNCPYPELDEKDRMVGVRHLLGYQNEELLACTRLLPAGISYDNVSLGRVAVSETGRGIGLGRELMDRTLAYCEQFWPGQSIDIGAQQYLLNFYQSFGFKPISEMYLEDGIPHLDMRLTK